MLIKQKADEQSRPLFKLHQVRTLFITIRCLVSHPHQRCTCSNKKVNLAHSLFTGLGSVLFILFCLILISFQSTMHLVLYLGSRAIFLIHLNSMQITASVNPSVSSLEQNLNGDAIFLPRIFIRDVIICERRYKNQFYISSFKCKVLELSYHGNCFH